MPQIPTQIRAILKEIGPVQVFKKGTVQQFSKCVITLQTVDDQILFAEVRNKRIDMLKPLSENSIVIADVIFTGSQKNNKKYNNILVTDIRKM